MFGFMAIAAQAEATFDQIQVLIEQRQYQAAEQGLEVIIKNHPQSAKAFYAMAQAQAGLGNLEKAQKALNLATGLNPTLDFAPASSVASLKQAITPQVAKIESIEESHFGRNLVLFGMFILFVVAMYFLYSVYARKRDEDEGTGTCPAGFGSTPPSSPTPPASSPTTTAKREYASTYSATPRPAYQGPTKSVAPTPAPAPAPTYSAPPTTIVNNNSSGSDLLTGMVIGNMLSGSHHSHDTTIIREREVVRESAPQRDSSWDNPAPTPRETKSSSWDDTPSKSSSWDDDSSSKSSSSWGSSSSSDSSSSWDSGSSSSDSGSSSSSWD